MYTNAVLVNHLDTARNYAFSAALPLARLPPPHQLQLRWHRTALEPEQHRAEVRQSVFGAVHQKLLE